MHIKSVLPTPNTDKATEGQKEDSMEDRKSTGLGVRMVALVPAVPE